MPAEFHYEPANPNDTVAEVGVADFYSALDVEFCDVGLPHQLPANRR
jgi:hypothetical protein